MPAATGSGAALWLNVSQGVKPDCVLKDACLGLAYTEEETAAALAGHPQLVVEQVNDIARRTADLIVRGEIVMWHQGRMEFGPRTLGARSILALPNSLRIKDALNLKLKRRVWYQPFCPTMLEETAKDILLNYQGPPNLFMTCGYRVRDDKSHLVQGVINVDATCRPQILPDNEPGRFGDLLRAVKAATGVGAVLNTSFNLHGEPVVCSPEDALRTFEETDINYLALGPFLVSKS